MWQWAVCFLGLALMTRPGDSKMEESFVRFSGEPEGVAMHTFSAGNVLVTAFLDQQGSLLDCHVLKNNASATRHFFKEAVVAERSGSLQFSMSEIDVRKLGRICKKFLRDTVRKPEKLQSPKEKLSRDRIELNNAIKGTRWCQRLSRPSHYEKLGEKSDLDSCCRDFHKCPRSIPGYSFSEGLMNPYPWSLPDCACSKAFNKCLRKISSPEADQLGTRFMNRLRLPCLEFEKKSECVKFDAFHLRCLETGSSVVAVRKVAPEY